MHSRIAIAALFVCLLAPTVWAKDKKTDAQPKECCKLSSCCANAANGKRNMKCSCRDGKKCDQQNAQKTSMSPFRIPTLIDNLHLDRLLDTSLVREPALPVRMHF
jgi:hypothetical protein